MLRSAIAASLHSRILTEVTSRNPLKYLQEYEVSAYLDTAIATVYTFTRPKRGSQSTVPVFMTELCTAIGHSTRNKLKLKKNSGLAAKTGAFILYSFEEAGILSVTIGAGNKGHQAYIVNLLDDAKIVSLWEALEITHIEKLPSETPYAPWVTSRHETGALLVKTGNAEVLKTLTAATHPIVFNCVNRAQAVGWNISREVYDVQQWALRYKTDAFADIWEQQNPVAKVSKLREAKAILSIARRFLNKTFFHLYSLDFRGRKYPVTAYLHEQGTDMARALLRRADSKPMTKDGFNWLLITIASTWAGDAGRADGYKTDKIPLKDRIAWAEFYEDKFLAYAELPYVNQEWMQADAPWQFLAACFELKRLREWQITEARRVGVDDWAFFENYTMPTHFEAYIDGSNNGSQHLAALTRDEITAPHVNLVPSALPGDLYKYVADYVWERLSETVATYSAEEIRACELIISELIELKRAIQQAEPRSEERLKLVEKIRAFKDASKDLIAKAGPVYWSLIVDDKHRRKIVKRNVMTLPYGGTAYGLGQQVIDDSKKHGIDVLLYLEHKWGAYLGREVFETCKLHLKRPMQLLSVFEEAGRAADIAGEFLSWTIPITNFPVVQNYTEGRVKKIYVQYGPPKGERTSTGYFENTYQLAVCFIEDVIPSKGKQATGASPNGIHGLDAGHLMLTDDACDFPITTIHDSFGALLPDMPVLFVNTRKAFVRLHEADPLESIMKEINGDLTGITRGTLDISLFEDSEFGFV